MTVVDLNRWCHRKKRYWTEPGARFVAAKCLEKRGAVLRVYKCQYCLGYHLTKQA